MLEYKIDFLANHRAFAEEVADLKYIQWRHTSPEREYSVWVSDIVESSQIGKLPFTIVAVAEDRLAGFVSIIRIDERANIKNEAWMITLFVKEAYRRQGIGAGLVRKCIAEAKSMGITDLYLWTDMERLNGYYQKLGWKYHSTDADGEDIMHIAT